MPDPPDAQPLSVYDDTSTHYISLQVQELCSSRKVAGRIRTDATTPLGQTLPLPQILGPCASISLRFEKNAETIRVTGKLKNLKGKVGVVTIRNLEESWDVKIPKGFLRWEIPEKLFKFIDLTGKVVWDSLTDERPVAEDGDLEAFTKIPLAKNVTKESFLKSANDIKSIAKDGKNKGRTTAIAAHLSNLYSYNSLRKLADVHFCETVEVKKRLNKKLLAKGMAQQIVDGDMKWEDVVRNETDLIPDDDTKQVKEANAILRQRLEETATNKGLSSNALLAVIGLENTSSGEDRAKLFREFQGRRGTESVKHEVLKKFTKGIEPIHTSELEGGTKRVLYGEDKASGKPKVTAGGLLKLLSIMIGLYSVCWNSHAADMWEHYRFVELLLRKYTIVSVAAWDWAVRSLSRLGEWHKGTLFSELCQVHLIPLSNANVDVSGRGGNQSWSSSHGNNNRTSQSTPGGRRAKLINKACWALVEGEVCNYGENCRFRHSCPACPGKKDHRKDTCPNSTSSKWDFKKPTQG
eukprot:g74024.t1